MSDINTHHTSKGFVWLLGIGASITVGILAWWRWWKPQIPIPTPQMRILTLNNQQKTPGTALITGASSGIGAAFARRLAADGNNLILVARREERLQTLADDLRQQYSIDADVLVADLATPAGVERVEQRIAHCPTLSMLINNAGFGRFGHFADVDIEKHLAMIHVHVLASVRLCRAALPGMVARHDGSIINVSSIAAFLPRPGNVIYNATKMYLKTFTEGLSAELADTGIRVQVLFPGLTSTEFFDQPEMGAESLNVPSFLWMSSEEVVSDSLAYLKKNTVICIPGLKNRVILALLRHPIILSLTRILIRYRASKTSLASTRPQ